MSIVQSIDTLTTAPTRADPTNFDARADALLTGLVTFSGQINTWATQANELAASTNINATNAASSATAAAASANAVVYLATTTYTRPDVVIGSNGHFYSCLATAGVTGTNPVTATAGVDWQIVSAAAYPILTAATGTVAAQDNHVYSFDTSGAAGTLNLPSQPVAMLTRVGVFDPTGDWSTNNLTLGRGGNSIENFASDCVCSLARDRFWLLYMGSANGGWGFFP